MTVFDTSVLIDHLRAVEAARDLLNEHAGDVSCSEVSRAEVIQGLRAHECAAAARLFAVIDWIPVDQAIARQAGTYGREYRASHQGMDIADLLIAATTQASGSELKTTNVKHFPMFPNLTRAY
jgi:hypothetical protein